MAGPIEDKFNLEYKDFNGVNPDTGIYEPEKAGIRELGVLIQDKINDINAAIEVLEVTGDNIIKDTWTALAASPGARDGQRGEVGSGDTGTHTDPVVGGTVDNAGIYSWVEADNGWQRVGDNELSSITAEVTTARDGKASLNDRLDRDYAEFDVLRDAIEEQDVLHNRLRIGKQTAPVTSASKLAESVLIFADPILHDNSRLVEFGIFSGGTGNVIPGARSRAQNSNNFVKVDEDQTIAVDSTGLKVYYPKDFGEIIANKGNHGCFYTQLNVVCVTSSASGTPYYATNGANNTTVTDATEARDFVIEAYMIWESPEGLTQKVTLNTTNSGRARREISAILNDRKLEGYTGFPGDFATSGTNAGAGHLVLVGIENFTRILKTFKHYSATETWATFWIYTQSGSVVKIKERFDPVKINVGLNDHTWLNGVELNPGEFMGVSCPDAGWVIYTTPGSMPTGYKGFLSVGWTALSSDTFTDATIDTTNIIQARIEWIKVRPSIETFMMFDDRGVTSYLGKQTVPTQGDGVLSSGSIIFRLNNTERFLMEELHWESSAASDSRWSFVTWNGTSWVVVQRLDSAAVNYASGTNHIYWKGIVEPGWSLMGQGYSSNWIRKTGSTPNNGWQYAALPGGGVYPDSITPSLSNSTDRAEVRITGKRLASEKHSINNKNTDKIEILGPSYTSCAYILEGKPWTSYISERTDWRVEAHGYSGETLNQILGRLRNGTFGFYPPVHYKDLGATYVFLMEGYNSWDHPTNNRTLAQYKDDAAKIIETVKGDGAIPVWVGEARRVYNEAGHAVFRTIAEKHGIPFIDVVQHTLRFDSGTKNKKLYQGVTGDGTGIAVDYHYGTRTYRMLASPIVKFVDKNMFNYKQGYKAFRLRDTVTYSDANEIIPRNNRERAKFWKELNINHTALSEATAEEFENLTFGTYTANQAVRSEYLDWQLGNSISFPDNGLLVYILDTVRPNMDGIKLILSDPTIQVFAKSSRVSPYSTDLGTSACKWLEITGTAGVFELNQDQLAGILDTDKIVFRLYKNGGFSMTEPQFYWFGKKGKPSRFAPTSKLVKNLGSELLATPACNTLTGWTATGSPNVDTSTTNQVPYGRTGCIDVNSTDKISQTVVAGTDNNKDRLIRVAIESRLKPILFDASVDTWPDDSQIKPESWDDRELLVELISPNGEVFDQTILTTPWLDEDECFFTLPMRVGNHTIRISGTTSEDIEIFYVSVKEVTNIMER